MKPAIVTICCMSLAMAASTHAQGRQTPTLSADGKQGSAVSNVRHVPIHAGLWAAGWAIQFGALEASCSSCAIPGGGAVLMGGFGALIGMVVGLVSREDAEDSSNSAFPGPSGRIGLVYNRLAYRSAFDTSAGGKTVAVAVQLSPHISTHFELSPTDRRFSPPSPIGDIAERVVTYTFSQLAGIRVLSRSRVGLEVLLGSVARGTHTRRTSGAPLDDGDLGFVVGMDAEMALRHGIALVPTFRYYPSSKGPLHSITYGVGVHWRIQR